MNEKCLIIGVRMVSAYQIIIYISVQFISSSQKVRRFAPSVRKRRQRQYVSFTPSEASASICFLHTVRGVSVNMFLSHRQKRQRRYVFFTPSEASSSICFLHTVRSVSVIMFPSHRQKRQHHYVSFTPSEASASICFLHITLWNNFRVHLTHCLRKIRNSELS